MRLRTKLARPVVLVCLVLAGCSTVQQPAPSGQQGLTPKAARAIAKEAYIYGFPMATNYDTMYKQAINAGNPDYRAPFNVLTNSANVATPNDKFVVTPNSDTPYSYLWMDLRTEPMIVTMPKIEKNRYYTGQIIDLYTYNFAYIGTRSYGNDGGAFMIAGPGWKGDTPKGVKAVFNSETEFAYVLFRTQLFNPADLANVKKIQAGYTAQPLSKFLKQPAPAAAASVNWPLPSADMLTTPALFPYVNFLLQFCFTNPAETDLMARFAKLGIGAGKMFDVTKLSPEMQKAVTDGIADAQNDMNALMKQINADQVSSAQMFGTRSFLNGNYLYRYAGAKLGLYGNSGEEAEYFGYFVDANHQPLDASKSDYVLTFSKGKLPPAKAFWSLTMYDGKSQFLVANPIKRYLLNSTMLKTLKYGKDGSLTIHVQESAPTAVEGPNWLPAPNGPFYAVLRLYMPTSDVVTGKWQKPPMQPVAAR